MSGLELQKVAFSGLIRRITLWINLASNPLGEKPLEGSQAGLAKLVNFLGLYINFMPPDFMLDLRFWFGRFSPSRSNPEPCDLADLIKANESLLGISGLQSLAMLWWHLEPGFGLGGDVQYFPEKEITSTWNKMSDGIKMCEAAISESRVCHDDDISSAATLLYSSTRRVDFVPSYLWHVTFKDHSTLSSEMPLGFTFSWPQ